LLEPMQPPMFAVLTGDLIGSTSSGSDKTDFAIKALSNAASAFSVWANTGKPRFTRSRGDSWQIILDKPGLSLRAALYLTAALHAVRAKLETRISIGIGTAHHLSEDTLSDAHGTAFVYSGQSLDQFKSGDRILINGGQVTELQSAVVLLTAERAERWSAEQAEAIMMVLSEEMMTLETAASRLGISKQAVSYRLKGAGNSAISRALNIWERNW
jgi:predicted DNA-binding protein (UPF0251 family)